MSSPVQLTPQGVYVGSWINWNRGPITGSTLTVTSRDGALLIAFLAVFVSWTGGQLLALISYIIHQRRSTPDARDALHHQQQVLLREGLPSASFLWRLIRATWAWKGNKGHKIVRRQSPLIVLAVTHCILVAVASVFVSRVIAETHGEVLVKSSVCGWPDTKYVQMSREKLTTLPGTDAFFLTGRWLYSMARQYTRNCYEHAGIAIPLCATLRKPTIDSALALDAPCPFDAEVCETEAMTLDTGFVDSTTDLGMNASPQNRVQFRKTLTCAVIPADRNYSTPWTTITTRPRFPWDPVDTLDPSGTIKWKYYNLGVSTILGAEHPSTFWVANTTAELTKPYRTIMFASFINDPINSSFRPLLELNRTDADVSILAIHNRAMYASAVHDPLFKATTNRSDFSARYFTPDLTVGVLGCTEQYQFCNGLAKCTNLSGLFSATPDMLSQQLQYSPIQLATVRVLFQAAFNMRLFNIHFLIDDSLLLTRDALYGFWGLSSGLPDRQWQREVRNLHNISMAVLQQSAVIHASPIDLELGEAADATRSFDWIVQETNPAQVAVCTNQKIRSRDYYSFNVLGLALLFTNGSVIIALGMLAPSITNYWRRRASHRQRSDAETRRQSKRFSLHTGRVPISVYRTKEWDLGDPLRLHRIALEEHGITAWMEGTDIPVPVEHHKAFKIPWLMRKHGEMFC